MLGFVSFVYFGYNAGLCASGVTESPPMRRRQFWGSLGALVLLALVGGLAWSIVTRPEVTPALRGEEVARRQGCFACHGPGGTGGVPDPGAPARCMPGWDGGTLALYARSEDEVRGWILCGAPRGAAPAGDTPSRSAGLVPMPAYAGSLSAGELDDLVAYVREVAGGGFDLPPAAYEGGRLAARLGCLGCHGPAGMGGLANPGSLTGAIPPWTGAQFADLVRDDHELREWILDGRPRRLWENPVARHFLEGQKIRMPAYREHLSDPEVAGLVNYIHWLRKR